MISAAVPRARRADTQRVTGIFVTVVSTGDAGRRIHTGYRADKHSYARFVTKTATNKGGKNLPRDNHMQLDCMLFDGINLMMPTMHRTMNTITGDEREDRHDC